MQKQQLINSLFTKHNERHDAVTLVSIAPIAGAAIVLVLTPELVSSIIAVSTGEDQGRWMIAFFLSLLAVATLVTVISAVYLSKKAESRLTQEMNDIDEHLRELDPEWRTPVTLLLPARTQAA